MPGKTGTPTFDLSKDREAQVSTGHGLTVVQLALERVITKVFSQYAIPLEISDAIRSTFKAKLWRVGKLYSKQGGTKRQEQLMKWKDGKDSLWNLTVNEVEVNRQLLKRKRSVEVQIKEECVKRKNLRLKLRS